MLMLFCIYNLLLQNEARKMNHQEVVEEDRRKKLPQNWEQKRKRVEWDEEQEKKRKVCLITKNIQEQMNNDNPLTTVNLC